MRYLATLFLAALFSMNVSAQNNSPMARYVEGVDYQILKTPVRPLKKGKIEVTEAFSYLCGACYNFESVLNKWEKGLADDAVLVKLPVVFQANMKHYARIMYTAEALGIQEKVNPLVFRAIHIQNNRLMNARQVSPIFESLGISPEKFKKTFNDFGVDTKVRQASIRTRAMKISATPQMTVDGRYSVSVPRQGGHQAMLKIVDFLLNKVRSESK